MTRTDIARHMRGLFPHLTQAAASRVVDTVIHSIVGGLTDKQGPSKVFLQHFGTLYVTGQHRGYNQDNKKNYIRFRVSPKIAENLNKKAF